MENQIKTIATINGKSVEITISKTEKRISFSSDNLPESAQRVSGQSALSQAFDTYLLPSFVTDTFKGRDGVDHPFTSVATALFEAGTLNFVNFGKISVNSFRNLPYHYDENGKVVRYTSTNSGITEAELLASPLAEIINGLVFARKGFAKSGVRKTIVTRFNGTTLFTDENGIPCAEREQSEFKASKTLSPELFAEVFTNYCSIFGISDIEKNNSMKLCGAKVAKASTIDVEAEKAKLEAAIAVIEAIPEDERKGGDTKELNKLNAQLAKLA